MRDKYNFLKIKRGISKVFFKNKREGVWGHKRSGASLNP
jgi:hypothetical protein